MALKLSVLITPRIANEFSFYSSEGEFTYEITFESREGSSMFLFIYFLIYFNFFIFYSIKELSHDDS